MILKNNWYYLGNCVSSFDEDSNSIIPQFQDASDFACVLEDCVPCNFLSSNQIAMPSDICSKIEFVYSDERNLLIGYDSNIDVHYFFAPVN